MDKNVTVFYLILGANSKRSSLGHCQNFERKMGSVFLDDRKIMIDDKNLNAFVKLGTNFGKVGTSFAINFISIIHLQYNIIIINISYWNMFAYFHI